MVGVGVVAAVVVGESVPTVACMHAYVMGESVPTVACMHT